LGTCVTDSARYIVTEYLAKGSLDDVLSKEKEAITLKEQLLMAFGATKGMVYLEKMQIIHRDLACRNLLVDKDNTVKVGDFGLAHVSNKDSGVYFNEGAMPIRWTAPECLLRDGFTSKSDVWSYGITFWEILNYAKEKPYADLDTAKEVTKYVIDGGRLDKPSNCPDEIWALLIECWYEERDERPTFAQISDKLETIIQILYPQTEIITENLKGTDYELSPNLLGYADSANVARRRSEGESPYISPNALDAKLIKDKSAYT